MLTDINNLHKWELVDITIKVAVSTFTWEEMSGKERKKYLNQYYFQKDKHIKVVNVRVPRKPKQRR